jgi:CRISPR-associated protein Csm4
MLFLVKLKLHRAIKIEVKDSSNGREFYGVIHSDTIFSGILNQWVRISDGESTMRLISNLRAKPPCFTVSSAFPYFYDEYYLPTPLGTGGLYMEKLKEVQFLKLTDFLDLAHGDIQRIEGRNLRSPLEGFINSHISPRVTIDRITTATNIYQEKGSVISEGGGLYFLIDLRDESLRENLGLCIKLLGESGIGGDRSIGYGHFDAEIVPINEIFGWGDLFQEKNVKNKCYYTLSLCCPREDEIMKAISYEIVPRSGWIFSNSSTKQVKRRACRMFTEGSLFSQPITGRMVDVTPEDFKSEHNVYRYGLGMMIEVIDNRAI